MHPEVIADERGADGPVEGKTINVTEARSTHYHRDYSRVPRLLLYHYAAIYSGMQPNRDTASRRPEHFPRNALRSKGK